MDLLIWQQKSLHGVIRDANKVINDSGFDMMKFLGEYIAQVVLFDFSLDIF